jgi:hypothetical protein
VPQAGKQEGEATNASPFSGNPLGFFVIPLVKPIVRTFIEEDPHNLFTP